MDERGTFARTWCRDELAEAGLATELAQCSLSRIPREGRCAGSTSSGHRTRRRSSSAVPRGDLRRRGRPSGRARRRAGEWFGVRLDPENGRALYVPEGCAHGFQTLIDESDDACMISTSYAPEASARRPLGRPGSRDRMALDGQRTMSDRDRHGRLRQHRRRGLAEQTHVEQRVRRLADRRNGSPERAATSTRLASPSQRGRTQRSAASSLSRPQAIGTGRGAPAAVRHTGTR